MEGHDRGEHFGRGRGQLHMNPGQIALASSHAAVHGGPCDGPDANVYLTDESGVLLADPEGNLIVEG